MALIKAIIYVSDFISDVWDKRKWSDIWPADINSSVNELEGCCKESRW